jgi:3-hydroxyacyl-[acyl-carrier-protein] dehydratase
MRFTLIDRIIEFEPGHRLTAVKALTLAEEYLADHFPHFPVMPGVLMLEAMTQAGAWLIRASEDFAHSIVVLREAQNVKYVQFLEPGQVLTVTAEILKQYSDHTRLQAHGTVEGKPVVNARLVLARYNLATTKPHYASTDRAIRQELRKTFAVLCQSNRQPVAGATAEPAPRAAIS